MLNVYLAHLVGDYIFQTDKMAIGKKTSSWVCLGHVAAYMIPFYLCNLTWWQLALIAVQHFAQDRTGFIVWFMKWKGSEQFATGPCSPWSIIVTDNVVHVMWIAAVVQAGL